MNIDEFDRAIRMWNPERRLNMYEVERWINYYRQNDRDELSRMLNGLMDYEIHGHLCVPFFSDSPAPFIGLAREIHREGYRGYFPDADLLPRDSAGRRILSSDTDSTQKKDVQGIAWMCYARHARHLTEADVYGLMYEIYPRQVHLYGCPVRPGYGWRTLPVGGLYMPADRPSPLSEWGLQRLDRLELLGAQIVELSGLSVRANAPDAGLIFHEIMRRMVHRGVIVAADGGVEKVLAFAIVEKTRNSIRTRMGRDNFVSLGESFSPPGEGVDKNTLLAPSIIEPSKYMDRLVSSYRDAQAAKRPLKTLIEGIRFYTQGLPGRYLSLSPDMIELLAELDTTAPSDIVRNAENGWHDRCGKQGDCTICNIPAYKLFRISDLLAAYPPRPRTLVA
jgi:hypothetical protein